MKILYVTSEAIPYSSSGGLGDVMGALPRALTEAYDNTEVEVIMPLYKTIKSEYKENFDKVCDLQFSLSWRKTGATVYKSENKGVTYYFIENHYYFDRNNLYSEYDDGERFAFFSTAVVEYILQSGNVPDILHANDWQSALSVIYLKTKYKDSEILSKIKSVYTIHNIEYQGKYDMAILGDVFALDNTFSHIVEHNGCINLMKGAIVIADYVTTVSPNYARELHYDFFAFGLSDIISSISNKFSGIINGIDYSVYSPDVGGDIAFPYSRRAFKTGKAKNKHALQKELALELIPNVPMLVMITRLVKGKGIDLVLHIIHELLSENIQLVVLGTGEAEYENAFLNLEGRYKNFKALMKFDRIEAKKMYAAADMLIMPSKSEPCGLAQMIACSYGAIPVVREVGGLYDTIIPYGKEGSNGFSFTNYNAHELLNVLKSAINLYKDEEKWSALVRRAIKPVFTWENSARKYMGIYNNLLG